MEKIGDVVYKRIERGRVVDIRTENVLYCWSVGQKGD